MQRQTRTLLVLAVIGLVGVAALAMLANRYRGMTPMKSVHDLPAAPEPEPAPPAAPEPREPSSVPAPVEPSATAQDVQGFVAARRALKGVMDEAPGAMTTIYREATRTTEGMGRVPMNTQLLIKLRSTRSRALQAAGVSWTRYERTRQAYRRWRGGSSAPEDADYVAEFERRKADLDACDLGKFEVVDDLFHL